jgi:hypothetical protein
MSPPSSHRAQLLTVAACVACVSGVVYSGGNTPATFFSNLVGGAGTVTGRGAFTSTSAADNSRHLLSSGGSCEPTADWEMPLGIIAYSAGVFFMFLGIAIVCDDFFVASLARGGTGCLCSGLNT